MTDPWQTIENVPEDRPILALCVTGYKHPYGAMTVIYDRDSFEERWIIYWPENDGIKIPAPSFSLWMDIPKDE